MRTLQTKKSSREITGGECLVADLTLILAVVDVIIADEVMGSATKRTKDIFRNDPVHSFLRRFYGASVAPKVVFQKKLPVLFAQGSDTRQVHLL